MKKQIHFLFFVALFITSITVTANNQTPENVLENSIEKHQLFFEVFNYSWATESGAVSYTLELVNVTTQQSFSWGTSGTSISAFNVPSGTYDVTVTAIYSNNSYSIIIADIIDH